LTSTNCEVPGTQYLVTCWLGRWWCSLAVTRWFWST